MGDSVLARSLDTVQRRIARRGMHALYLGAEADALQLAEAVIDTSYYEPSSDARFFGVSSDTFHHAVISNELMWAPDGDAAFDDGGHVLHFDVGDQVRLIAFVNPAHREGLASSLAEIWISAEEFYGCLHTWQSQFLLEWAATLNSPQPTTN